MAFFSNVSFVQLVTADGLIDFGATYSSGDIAPTSGIYRCTACGYEAVSTAGNTLPPESHAHARYAEAQALVKEAAARTSTVMKIGKVVNAPHKVSWQLIVAAAHT